MSDWDWPEIDYDRPTNEHERVPRVDRVGNLLFIALWMFAGWSLHSCYANAHTSDPHSCAYWLHSLEKISVWEEQLTEIAAWKDELEPQAVTTWENGLKRRIKEQMEKIERECQ